MSMTIADLQGIETELAIRLPEAYRRVTSPYQLEHVAMADCFILDDANLVISHNLIARSESEWSADWFIFGHDGGETFCFMDLSDEHLPVRSIEMEGSGSASIAPTFEAFIEQILSGRAGQG